MQSKSASGNPRGERKTGARTKRRAVSISSSWRLQAEPSSLGPAILYANRQPTAGRGTVRTQPKGGGGAKFSGNHSSGKRDPPACERGGSGQRAHNWTRSQASPLTPPC